MGLRHPSSNIRRHLLPPTHRSRDRRHILRHDLGAGRGLRHSRGRDDYWRDPAFHVRLSLFDDLLARTDPRIMQRSQVLLQREAADEGEEQCILRLLRQGHTRRRLDHVRRLPSECLPAAL